MSVRGNEGLRQGRYCPSVKRSLAAVILLLVLASCADIIEDPVTKGGRGTPEGSRRIVKVQDAPRTFTCTDPADCRVATLAVWPVPDPAGPEEFQLVISLTFSYRLTSGDLAHLGISTSCPLTNPPAPCPTPVPMQLQPLASHDGPMTTTVTWALPPSGGPGSFVYFMATLDDRSGDDSVELTTRHITAVFEMWPR